MNTNGKKRVLYFNFTLRHERKGFIISCLYVLEAELFEEYDGVKKAPKFVVCGRHGASKDILHFHGAPGTSGKRAEVQNQKVNSRLTLTID